MTRNAHYNLDSRLLPRISAILLAPRRQQQSALTVDDIVDELCRLHPEYQRKPRNGFTKQVAKVCDEQKARALAAQQQQQSTLTPQQQQQQKTATTTVLRQATVQCITVPVSGTKVVDAPPAVAFAHSSTASGARSQLHLTNSNNTPLSSSSHDNTTTLNQSTAPTPATATMPIVATKSDMTVTCISSDSSDSDEDDERSASTVIDLVQIEDTNRANQKLRRLYSGSTAQTLQAAAAPSTATAAPAPTTASGNKKSINKRQYDESADDEQQQPPNNKRRTNSSTSAPVNNKKARKKRIDLNAIKDSASASRNSSTKRSDEMMPPLPSVIPGSSGWQPVQSVSHSNYSSLGGLESVLQSIHDLIELPLLHADLFAQLGVAVPSGVLLHGAPGCGKTTLAWAIAGQLGVSFFSLSATEIVSGVSGESESNIRKLFAAARAAAPSIIFMDEIDSIATARGGAENAGGAGQKQMETRIVAQLLTCMDELAHRPVRAVPVTSAFSNEDDDEKLDGEDDDEESMPSGHVIVLAATNRAHALDPALRRPGRFDREIAVPVPNEEQRLQILRVMTKQMRANSSINNNAQQQIDNSNVATSTVTAPMIDTEIDLSEIARLTSAYTGADLKALVTEAATCAVHRMVRKRKADESSRDATAVTLPTPTAESIASTTSSSDDCVMSDAATQFASASITTALTQPLAQPTAPAAAAAAFEPMRVLQSDFVHALRVVQPSSRREGFVTLPDVTWDDIGACEELRADLRLSIVQPILQPKLFKQLGLTQPAGILLHGPPGTGKTLIAKALANECRASFMCVNGSELLNQYVGQSEFNIRQLFTRAQASAPCLIFFDEVDAIAPRRTGSSEGNNVSERVVAQLLTCLSGLGDRNQVFVVAASNRPLSIDPALLRPGRIDKLIQVGLPSQGQRAQILGKLTRSTPLGTTIDLSLIAADSRAEGLTGADCAQLVREAALNALREFTQADAQSINAPLPELTSLRVEQKHFLSALAVIRPSVSPAERLRYEKMQQQLQLR